MITIGVKKVKFFNPIILK